MWVNESYEIPKKKLVKELENFILNLGKVCKKSVEFQNEFREHLKVETLEI